MDNRNQSEFLQHCNCISHNWNFNPNVAKYRLLAFTTFAVSKLETFELEDKKGWERKELPLDDYILRLSAMEAIVVRQSLIPDDIVDRLLH